MHGYWGDFIFGYATALIFTLAFESPIIGIERFMFGGGRRPRDKPVIEDIKPECSRGAPPIDDVRTDRTSIDDTRIEDPRDKTSVDNIRTENP
ncbi:hypothetical protein ILUMI_24375 [Ignelater luminosus]|uniref:Uncharacterized protein n=1 Tax=Ignelater luminosus TaxID=2038154 RepID=A0A8K0G125_IGNLU|nr:hypothetical protein ILUMI_24375 [Ignelater luminosus]